MDWKSNRNVVLFVVITLVIMTGTNFFQRSRPRTLSYSEFQTLLTSKKVTEVLLTPDRLEGQAKAENNNAFRFVVTRVEPAMAELLSKHAVKFSARTENVLFKSILSWIIPLALFVGVWVFFIRRAAKGLGSGGGFMAIGKSKAKVYVETDIRVSFKDVAGIDEAKAELQEIVAFLKNPETYGRLGARMPKGVLLVGPPGTGKTLLARALAGEAGVPFLSISGSEFVEMFVGVGAARVRDLFQQARQKAPCIIFIDELDALGRARSAQAMAGGGGHDEKEQTLNQLLSELDGFDSTSGIVLLGATNRPEILDPALLRAGRFDRQILVDRPDKVGRVAILAVHVKKISIDLDVPLDSVAALTPGFTGADLANLVNEAALSATRRNASTVTMHDFNLAIERIVAGLERKSRILNPTERRTVAYHEMGHALVAAALPGSDVVHKISIIPRGIGALGYTIQRPTEDRYLMSRGELENKMAVLLGGRAAEEIIFGHRSTGAADDLAKATDIARNMVTRYGMYEKMGHVVYETDPVTFLGPAFQPRRDYSEETAREIDCALREVLEQAHQQAFRILNQHRSVLQQGADRLIELETLDGDTLREILSRVKEQTGGSKIEHHPS